MSLKTKIKNLALKILYGYYDSESYIRWLRQKGVTIGEGTYFNSPRFNIIDTTRPYALKIGKNVIIAAWVTILTHGYEGVIKGLYNDLLGSFGEVVIGDNVFIGIGATILKGCHIGDNVIIGAGSVVAKDLAPNAVYGGNPVKRICSIEEYHEKRLAVQITEAKEQFLSYYRKYGEIPPKRELHEFFFLFEDRKKELDEHFRKQIHYFDKFELCEEMYWAGHRQQFANYDEFSKYCLEQISENSTGDKI